jgi:hypothetical protein
MVDIGAVATQAIIHSSCWQSFLLTSYISHFLNNKKLAVVFSRIFARHLVKKKSALKKRS